MNPGTFGTFGVIRENTISGSFSLTLLKKEASVPNVPPFFQIDFFQYLQRVFVSIGKSLCEKTEGHLAHLPLF